ncbi:glycosyltransferase family 4 protein [Clostridium oceanicum]|uniref:Glycosyltransferase n=1 Tax=Clostridium oceanicum TaxID=1543 RepID=A0ABP3UZA4_9CLOT
MKKILNIIAQKPNSTGSGIYLQSLVKEADKKDYKQAVIAGISKYDTKVSFDSVNKVDFYPVIFETENMPFPVIGMSDVMPYNSTKYRDLSKEKLSKWKEGFSKALKKSIEEFKPDIIICHHLWLLTALTKDLVLNNIPVIGFCHGTDLRQMKSLSKKSKNIFKETINYIKYNCRNLDLIIASHSNEKNEIIKYYGIDKNKIVLGGSGYNSDVFYNNYEKNKNLNDLTKIVYAGKLSFSKGVPSLINSLNLLKEKNKNFELFLAGSGTGEELDYILNLCKKSKFKIHILGPIPQSDLGNLFRKSNILVLPSFYEGMPLVLIEAMACGIKIVSSDLPGLKEWMGKTINNSGIINYVPLPRIENIDVPLDEDLPEFEKKLGENIENHFNKLITYDKKLKKSIENKSWRGAFEDLEKYF